MEFRDLVQHLSESYHLHLCCTRQKDRWIEAIICEELSEWVSAVTHHREEAFNLSTASVLNYPSLITGSYPLEQLIGC